nr:type II toxin-antitoxin system VapC family toxin [Knoellia sp. DB2414S]
MLDSNALLWLLTADARLGPLCRQRLGSQTPAYFSPISVVELTIKEMVGKLRLMGSLPDGARRAGLRELPLTSEHAGAIASFPELARHDPLDRMLLAQARTEGMRLLTSDRRLLAAAPELTVDARE